MLRCYALLIILNYINIIKSIIYKNCILILGGALKIIRNTVFPLVLHYKPNAPNNPDPNPYCTVYAQNNFLVISLITYNDSLCRCF